MNDRLGWLVIAMIASLTFSPDASASIVKFTPLIDSTGQYAFIAPIGVSGDGSVVLAESGGEALLWTRTGGFVGLGFGGATAISADGSVIVGYSGGQAFRWTSVSGMTSLGGLPSGSVPTAVSADGSVVVGFSGGQAFRWTADGGMLGLGGLGGAASYASDVSLDGSVVVGTSGGEPFRWTSGGGMVGISDFEGRALGVSGDGSVVVGYYLEPGMGWAFRWTTDEGMTGILHSLIAWDVSADGLTVVGGGNEFMAFIWDPVRGMRLIRDVLQSAGAIGDDFPSLTRATMVSADGRTIVGWGGEEPDYFTWVAYLGNVPEPGSFLIWGLPLVGLVALGRGRRILCGK